MNCGKAPDANAQAIAGVSKPSRSEELVPERQYCQDLPAPERHDDLPGQPEKRLP